MHRLEKFFNNTGYDMACEDEHSEKNGDAKQDMAGDCAKKSGK